MPAKQHPRRVAVTGIGLVTPCGVGTQASWVSFLAGKSGIAPITLFDASAFETRFAGEVKDWDPSAFVESRRRKEMGRFIEFALGASLLAWQDAGLPPLSP